MRKIMTKKKSQKRKIDLEEYREHVVTTLAVLKTDVRNNRASLEEVKFLLREQNGRIRKNEVSLSWMKGVSTFVVAVFSAVIAWLFNK